MKISVVFKTTVIAYAIFSTIFLLCVDWHTLVRPAFIEILQSFVIADTHDTHSSDHDAMIGTHVDMLPSNTMSFVLFIAVALIIVMVTVHTRRTDQIIRAHLRLWRDWGGGSRLHNFYQKLFAAGLLSPKIFDVVHA